VTTDDGNYIVFHNPGTKEVGTFVQVMRVDPLDGKAHVVSKPRILNAKNTATIMKLGDMLFWSRFADPELRVRLDKHFGVELTDGEFGQLSNIIRKTANDAAKMPLGISFHDDFREANPKLAAGMTEFIHRIGLQNALIKLNMKLRFGMSNAMITPERMGSSTFDYFASLNRAHMQWANDAQGNRIFTISRNPSFTHLTDLHELGHVMHHVIDAGGYGGETKVSLGKWLDSMVNPTAEFNIGKEFLASMTTKDDGKGARAGAQTALDIIGLNEADRRAILDSDQLNLEKQRQHYLKRNELVAQLFHGIVAEPESKFVQFVKTHFEPVYKLFKTILSAFSHGKVPTSADVFSPGYVKGREILKGLLDAQYAKSAEHAKELAAIVKSNHDLEPRALETLVHAWYDNVTPEMHEAI
jgi:hypothetical protein